jgi:hypothetical protein
VSPRLLRRLDVVLASSPLPRTRPVVVPIFCWVVVLSAPLRVPTQVGVPKYFTKFQPKCFSHQRLCKSTSLPKCFSKRIPLLSRCFSRFASPSPSPSDTPIASPRASWTKTGLSRQRQRDEGSQDLSFLRAKPIADLFPFYLLISRDSPPGAVNASPNGGLHLVGNRLSRFRQAGPKTIHLQSRDHRSLLCGSHGSPRLTA